MKVSTTTMIGLLFGFVIGIIGFGRVNNVSPDLASVASKIHEYMLWIVLLALLVPLADYFVSTNLPATIIGFVARQPFRHLAGFFTGIAVGLLALNLFAPQMFQSTHLVVVSKEFLTTLETRTLAFLVDLGKAMSAMYS